MRAKITLIVAIAVLMAATGGWGWQDSPRRPGAGQPGTNYGPPPPSQSNGAVRQVQQGAVQLSLRSEYKRGYSRTDNAPYPDQRPARVPYGGQSQQGHPRNPYFEQPTYPYPPYHNPYYTGRSAGNVLSGLIDWIVGLPTNAMNRFSNFMDDKVFPTAPATHGGSQAQNSDKPNAQQAVPENAPPLPPAGAYKPKSR
jgi:hypothetical protein